MTRAPKPMYTNQTYGTTEELNERQRDVDNKEITGRNNNLPPAAVNTQDNVNNAVVNPGQEETVSGSIATSETETINGDSVGITNFDIFNVLRDSDFANENATAGAIPPTITPQEEGDMNFAVLADLAENSDVDALRRIYSYNL